MQRATKYKEIFELFLIENLPKVSPIELFEPYKYITLLPSKRFRPTLMLATYECYKPIDDEILYGALIIELFHNFTLIHDDIMDKSETRRGFETVHKKFGNNTAILSGDVLLILTYQLLEKLQNNKKYTDIFSLFNKTAIEICSGQQYDINFEKDNNISEIEYLMMIENKTAILLGTSLKFGNFLANTSSTDSENFFEFGKNLGMAYQIQDDILDSFGQANTTGKIVGGDICNNKKTLLMIKAKQSNNRYHKELLDNWSQTTEFNQDKINDLVSIFKESGAYDFCINKRDKYVNTAIEYLDQIDINKEAKDLFYKLTTSTTSRDY